jgi:hypothetical protein
MRGYTSRIEIGFTLLTRIGLYPAGAIDGRDAPAVAAALSSTGLGGDPGFWIAIAISIALSLAASFLLPKLTRPNLTGRYGFDNLVTQQNTQLPLPDILGAVTVAGNSPFITLVDKSQTLGGADPTQQHANQIVILGSGPISQFDANGVISTINGLAYSDPYYYGSNPDRGVALNPPQDEADCVTGTINGDANRSSVTFYDGSYDIAVPVDIRAQFDRGFPLYGFSGCAYHVYRLINSNKFPSFNLNTNVAGRLVRQYTSGGFTTTAVSGESLAGADGSKVRFKLANWDVAAVSSITVNATAYNPISTSAQSGNVYKLNATKGYVEFITAPAAAATVLISYTFYPRIFSNNPADLLVYLLTDILRGKGYDPSKINFTRAVALQTYCAAIVTWQTANGPITGPRYTCNYAIDSRKPLQDHLKAVLDSCYGYLFISGGQFVMKARAQDTAVMDFNASSILAGSFSSEMIDRSIRANRVHVFYHSANALNAETETVREDVSDQVARATRGQGDNGIVESTLKVPSIDNESQAERFGEQILREQVTSRWTCQFTTNIQGLALEPGDLITVIHPSRPTWSQKVMRIEQASYDPQDRLILTCTEYFDGAYI